METVIKLITHHAPILPVFIVGTKKDQFLKLQDGVENKQIEALERSEELDTKIQARVNHLLEDRQRFFETRYREECKGYNEKTMRFAFVSKGKRPHASQWPNRITYQRLRRPIINPKPHAPDD